MGGHRKEIRFAEPQSGTCVGLHGGGIVLGPPLK